MRSPLPRTNAEGPTERVRRRAAARAVLMLLALALAWRLGAGWQALYQRRVGGEPCELPAATVDLGTDPPWRLALLPGIGLHRAWEIARDRQRPPPYRRLEDLRRVRGIGPKILAAIRADASVRVRLNGAPVGCADDRIGR